MLALDGSILNFFSAERAFLHRLSLCSPFPDQQKAKEVVGFSGRGMSGGTLPARFLTQERIL
jgi:hypothetical protein